MPNWKKVITSGSEASLNKLVVDGSIGHVSASLFSGSFYGDGSNLTGIEAGIFIQTGSIYATTNDLQVTGSLNITDDVLIGDIDAIEDRYITLPGRSGGNAGILFNDRGTIRASLIYDGNQDFVLSTDVPNAQSGPRDFIFKSNGKEMFTINGNLGNIFVSGSADILNKLFIRNVAADTTLSNKALVLKTFDGEVQSRDLGDSAFQDTGSMTVLNADSADTATNVNIGTLTTAGEKDILYTGGSGKVSQDTSGEFTYDPDANLLSVDNLYTSVKGIITELTSSRLQVAGIDYPTSDGTNGQVVTTNGSGQLTFTTIAGGTDTNIANTDLTANANRTLAMDANSLTFSEVNIFTVGTTGGIVLNSTEETFLTGIANATKPHMLYWDSSDGRIVYASTGSIPGTTYTAGTGISINGSNVISSTITQTTVYTPNVFSATTKNNVTTATTGPEFSTTDNIGGNSGASIDATNAYELHLAENVIYEITYSIKSKSNTTTNSGRNSVGFYARPFDTAGSGGADIPGSTSIMYYRNTAYGHTNTHNCTFYYDTSDLTNFEHIRLYLEEAYGDGDVNILSGTISARRIS